MEVTLYSKPVCQQCKASVRKLDKHEIAFSTTDMEADESALSFAKSLGYAEAPVILVHRDGVLVDHWSGFRPDKIEELISQN